MSEAPQPIDHRDDDDDTSPTVRAARARLDSAVLGYNRQAKLVEQFRLAGARFRELRQPGEPGATDHELVRDAVASAAACRAEVRVAVGDFVRQLRDAGIAPEVALVAVKQRLMRSATAAAPGAPGPDASQLERDAGSWAINAYFGDDG